MAEKRTVDISTGIIFRTVLILLGLWLLYLIRDIIALFFVSIIMTVAIEPVVNRLSKKRIPRTVAVLIIYLALFLIFGIIISLIVPYLAIQLKDFSHSFPLYAEQITKVFSGLESYLQSQGISFSIEDFFKNIETSLFQSTGEIFSTTIGFFSGLISLIVVLSITFYMSVQRNGIKKFLVSVTPAEHQEYAASLVERINEKIGRWMQGQIFLMATIFILDFLALYFLGIPYALILAIIGGILEIIPYVGPVISAVPAVFLGFLVSPLSGLLVIAAYVVIQQVENHIIVPQVMKKAVGLNPVVVILALLAGAKLGGVFGAILAVPVATVLGVFISDLIDKKSELSSGA